MQGNSRVEGFIASVGSATSQVLYHSLGSGTGDGVMLRNVKINIPGAASTTQVMLRQGSGTAITALTGSVPLLAFKDDGFEWKAFGERDGIVLTNGSVNLLVVGNDVASKTAYVNIDYQY
jgi:hypothetical protein